MYAGSGVANGAKRYYRADPQGSIIALTDYQGNVVDTYTYDAYGMPDDPSGQPIRYMGRRWEAETGLYHFRSRAFSPALGRFLQTDPAGYGENVNLYAFGANDPLNGRDPSGEVWGLLVRVVKVGKRVIKAKGNFKKALKDEFASVVDNGATLLDGDLNVDDAFAVIDLATGLGSEAKAGLKALKGADNAGDAARGVCSFLPGTLVLTEGGLFAIETLQVGNLVWAEDPETGKQALMPIAELLGSKDRPYYELWIKGEGGAKELHYVTGNHPYYLLNGGWVWAEDLEEGMVLKAKDGKSVTVLSIKLTGKTSQTHNLEVEGFHTYYVGELTTLVHNACRGKNRLKPDENASGDHSTFKRDKDENITNTATFKENPQNPSGFDEVSRTDVVGDPHFNKVTGEDVPTPHVQGKDIPGGVRPAKQSELPKVCTIVDGKKVCS